MKSENPPRFRDVCGSEGSRRTSGATSITVRGRSPCSQITHRAGVFGRRSGESWMVPPRPEHVLRGSPVFCDALIACLGTCETGFSFCAKGGVAMAYNEKQTQCITLLQETAKALGRLPQKSDFSPEVMGQIKNLLGPWPRALEAAGLKAQNTRQEQKLQKRIRAKRRRTQSKLAGERRNEHG